MPQPTSSNAKIQPQSTDVNDSQKQDIFVEGDPALNRSSPKATSSDGLKPQKLAYLTEMLLELKKLSDEIDEPMTTYLIEMAYMEAATAQNLNAFKSDSEG